MATVLWKAITGRVDNAVQEQLESSPSYRRVQKELVADGQRAVTVETVSIVAGLTGIFALTALAVKYFEDDRSIMGGACLAGTVPLSLLSYDCYQAAENLRSQLMENHTELIAITKSDKSEKPIISVSRVAMRKCLLKGTVFFEPVLGLYCAACIGSLKEES